MAQEFKKCIFGASVLIFHSMMGLVGPCAAPRHQCCALAMTEITIFQRGNLKNNAISRMITSLFCTTDNMADWSSPPNTRMCVSDQMLPPGQQLSSV